MEHQEDVTEIGRLVMQGKTWCEVDKRKAIQQAEQSELFTILRRLWNYFTHAEIIFPHGNIKQRVTTC